MDRSKIEHLMVYGTLLRDLAHPFHSILTEFSEFSGQAAFRGLLYDLGEYPGVHTSTGSADLVRGELYRLSQPRRALLELDAYESHYPKNPSASLFRREVVDVFRPDGTTLKAWVYCYNQSVSGKVRIASGDYLHFLRERRAAYLA